MFFSNFIVVQVSVLKKGAVPWSFSFFFFGGDDKYYPGSMDYDFINHEHFSDPVILNNQNFNGKYPGPLFFFFRP